jgi:hypothetical protein
LVIINVLDINQDGSTYFKVLTIKGSHKTWDIPNGQRVVCEYNNASQPVGFSALKFRRMTGKIIRSGNYVRIRDDWAKVPQCTKEDIWDALMVWLNYILYNSICILLCQMPLMHEIYALLLIYIYIYRCHEIFYICLIF